MNQNDDEIRGIHGKSINYYTGTGHWPRTGHPYIKATHHEWNNSKEKKKDSLSDFQVLLFVFECVVVIITQKEIHTLQG